LGFKGDFLSWDHEQMKNKKISNHQQEDLAKFGFKPEKTVL